MEPPHQHMVIKIERTLQAYLLRMGTLLLKRLRLRSLDHLLLALILRCHMESADWLDMIIQC
jgi:hypothetical protein